MKYQIVVLYHVLILEMVHHCFGKCTRYYTVLEMEPPGFINPKKISEILSMGYPFNTTEEYRILQNNLDCVLDITGCDERSVTECLKPIKTIYRKPIDEYIPLKKKDNIAIEPFANPEVTNTVGPTFPLTESMSVKPTVSSTDMTETTTDILTKPSSEIPNVNETITTEVSNENTTVIPTEVADTETTVTPTIESSTGTNDSVSGSEYLNLSEEKKKQHMKTAAIIAGSVAGVSLLVFLAKNTLTVLQSGSYRFPDSPQVN